MLRFLILIFLIASCAALAAPATPPLTLSNGNQALHDYLSYVLVDPVDSAGASLHPPPESVFTPYRQSPSADTSPNFGYTDQRLWLRFAVTNPGNQTQSRIIRTGQRYMRPLIFFERHNSGQLNEILYNDEYQSFSARPIALPELMLPITLEPYETREYYIYAGAAGALSLNLTTTTLAEEEAKHQRSMYSLFFIEGVIATLILLNLGYFAATRRNAHLIYVGQMSLSILFIAHMDGQAFQYFWPEWPSLNRVGTQVLGHGVNLFGSLFVIAFLSLRSLDRRLFMIAASVCVISAVFMLLTPWIPALVSNQVGTFVTSTIPLIYSVFGWIAWRRGNESALYFAVAWICLGVCNIMFGATVTGLIATPLPVFEWIRIGILTESLIIAVALFDQVRRLNLKQIEQQSVIMQNLSARLEEAKERVALEEENHARTLQVANMERKLATTSHDVRQPIYALRLSLLSLSDSATDARTLDLLNQTLDQMESVLTDNLDQVDDTVIAVPSSLHIDEVTQSVARALESEASANGIAIKTVGSSMKVGSYLQIPLQRIVQNAVVNAIKHAQCKRILVGVRRVQGKPRICILDDGRGMPTSGQWETAGTGLGMSIIQEICEQHDLSLSIESEPNKGTGLNVQL